jgi:hypothetical protein
VRRAGKLDVDRTVHLVGADPIFGASTEHAVAHASAWLGSTRHDSPLTQKNELNMACDPFQQLSDVGGFALIFGLRRGF